MFNGPSTAKVIRVRIQCPQWREPGRESILGSKFNVVHETVNRHVYEGREGSVELPDTMTFT